MRRSSNPEKHRYNRIAPVYDLMEFFPEKVTMGNWRKRLFSYLPEGRILELGVGTGKNLVFYPENKHLIAVDISLKMIRRAREKKPDYLNVSFAIMNAEELALLSDSFDGIVTTFVFCSVFQPVNGLKELKRVLKPGGTALFLEHVRPGNKVLAKLFDLLNPVVVRIFGANINRTTTRNIKMAGFEIEEEHNLRRDIVKLIIARKKLNDTD